MIFADEELIDRNSGHNWGLCDSRVLADLQIQARICLVCGVWKIPEPQLSNMMNIVVGLAFLLVLSPVMSSSMRQ